MKCIKPKTVWAFFSLVILAITIITARELRGAVFHYLIFTIVFNSILAFGFFQKKSYTVTFLSLFLWLGFWLKTSSRVLIGPAEEPVGLFDYSWQSWSNLFLLSVAGGLGAFFAGVFGCRYLRFKGLLYFPSDKPFNLDWYERRRKSIMTAYVLVVGTLSFVNFQFGLHIIGLRPAHDLPFIIEKAHVWLIMHGFVMMSCCFIFWDELKGRSTLWSFYILLFEAFMTNTSKLSRAYVFHSVPQMYAYVLRRSPIRLRHLAFAGVFLFLFFISAWMTSQLRQKHFLKAMGVTVAAPSDAVSVGERAKWADVAPKIIELAKNGTHFVVNRWVGLEAAMAVTSCECLGKDLFLDGIFDIARPGRLSVFDERVAHSSYKGRSERVQFATLTGGIAFFYFSGSLLVTFAGMFFLTFIGIFMERICQWMTGNKYLCAYIGATMALTISQFGYQPLKFFLYLISFLISFYLIYAVQRPASLRGRLRSLFIFVRR